MNQPDTRQRPSDADLATMIASTRTSLMTTLSTTKTSWLHRNASVAADHLPREVIVAQRPAKQLLSRPRRSTFITFTVLGAAAVLTIAIAAPALFSDNDGQSPTARQTVDTGKGQTESFIYASATIKAALKNPRLLVAEPGWKATDVSGFTRDQGSAVFAKGDRDLEFDWYPSDTYEDRYEDLLDGKKPDPISVAGQQATLVRYSAGNYTVIMKPDGRSFVTIVTGAGWTDESKLIPVLAKVTKVDVGDWLAAMPSKVVTPAKASDVADEILAGMTLPPGFNRAHLTDLGTNDRYHFGARIADQFVCGWLTTWTKAYKGNDPAVTQRAVEALKSMRHWNILNEMKTQGQYAQSRLRLADQVAIGDDPASYLQQFHCLGQD